MNKIQKSLMTLTAFALFAFSMVIIFNDSGFVDLQEIKKQRDEIIKGNEHVRDTNRALYREIDRLKNDTEFIENVARRELGMIGRDELILKPQGHAVKDKR
ncbi:MAG: septum formation initiator family protein [Deltaproteobacteria bacterium]|nr:septum formation initiator family protein [Deltaproteobacteria bacterium]